MVCMCAGMGGCGHSAVEPGACAAYTLREKYGRGVGVCGRARMCAGRRAYTLARDRVATAGTAAGLTDSITISSIGRNAPRCAGRTAKRRVATPAPPSDAASAA
eukprot:7208917-Prymnesium_polylepis.3